MTNTNFALTVYLGLIASFISLPSVANAAPVLPNDPAYQPGYEQKQYVSSFEQDIHEMESRIAEHQAKLETVERESKLRWRSGLRTTAVYESNVFDEAHDPKDDVYFVYEPSVGVSLGEPTRRYAKDEPQPRSESEMYFETFYVPSYVDYIENQKLSGLRHLIRSQYEYRGAKTKLYVKNEFRPHSATDTGERRELRTGGSSQVTAHSDDLSVRYEYELTPKTRLAHNYAYEYDYYPRSLNKNTPATELFSTQSHTFNPRVSHDMTPKTSFFADYKFETTDFFRGGLYGSKFQDVAAGVLYRWTPKTHFSFDSGYGFRDYNEEGFVDEDGWQYHAAIRHAMTEKTSITLYNTRDLQEDLSIQGATPFTQSLTKTADYFGLTLQWDMTPHMSLSVDGSLGFTERDGFATLVDPENGTLTHTRDREEDIYQLGAAWTWRPYRNWEVILGYSFYKNDASFSTFDYEDHKVIGSAEWLFS